MEPLVSDDLTITVAASPSGGVSVYWLGKSVGRDPRKILGPFLREVLVQAKATQASISMHFEKLEHFNSTTIAALVHFINDAEETAVPLFIHYDSAVRWQSLSFKAIQSSLQPFEKIGTGHTRFITAQGGG